MNHMKIRYYWGEFVVVVLVVVAFVGFVVITGEQFLLFVFVLV